MEELKRLSEVRDEAPVIDKVVYPEALYHARRISAGGGQPVFSKLLPDGEDTRLYPGPSQRLVNHSPDGFNWSFGGSGPAQLALALLLDATTDPEKALSHYQHFKWEKVAGWGNEWSITRSEILLWIEEQTKQQLKALLRSRN